MITRCRINAAGSLNNVAAAAPATYPASLRFHSFVCHRTTHQLSHSGNMNAACTSCHDVTRNLATVLEKETRFWTWTFGFPALIEACTKGCGFCRFIDDEVLAPWYRTIGEPPKAFNESTVTAVGRELSASIPRGVYKPCREQPLGNSFQVMCCICYKEDSTSIAQGFYCGNCPQHQARSHASPRYYCNSCLRLAARSISNGIRAFGRANRGGIWSGCELTLTVRFSLGRLLDIPNVLMVVLEQTNGDYGEFIVEAAGMRLVACKFKYAIAT